MRFTESEAQRERESLVQKFIQNQAYTGFESEASGVNHLAFITADLERTIEFYTQVIRLKMLRVRPAQLTITCRSDRRVN